MKVYLNGEYVERSQAKVSIDDRGFLFGDGVYEVTRIRGGRFFEGERHERRLARNLAELELVLPEGVTPASLGEVALRLAAENGIGRGEALAYFQVTRGVAPRAHQFPVGVAPTVFVSVGAFSPPDALRTRGVACVSYPDIRWSRCDIKSVNLLPNVLAKQYAVSKGAYEAFFVRDGAFTEGASTNFFAVVDGEIRTYRNSNLILPGISRDVALDLASAEGIAVREEPLRVDELPRAAELFLTSTMNDVMPVVSLDGRTIGDGRPGPVTARLARVVDAHIAEQCGPAVGAAATV
jgi:D-alanine transaminase